MQCRKQCSNEFGENGTLSILYIVYSVGIWRQDTVQLYMMIGYGLGLISAEHFLVIHLKLAARNGWNRVWLWKLWRWARRIAGGPRHWPPLNRPTMITGNHLNRIWQLSLRKRPWSLACTSRRGRLQLRRILTWRLWAGAILPIWSILCWGRRKCNRQQQLWWPPIDSDRNPIQLKRSPIATRASVWPRKCCNDRILRWFPLRLGHWHVGSCIDGKNRNTCRTRPVNDPESRMDNKKRYCWSALRGGIDMPRRHPRTLNSMPFQLDGC